MEGEKNAVIEFIDVTFSFGSKLVFDRINLTVYQGDFIILCGPSGSGTSTLLKIGAGLLNPQSGRVLLNGYDTVRSKKKDLMRLKSKNGFFFSDDALFSTMSAYANLALHAKYNTDLSDEEIEAQIRPWTDIFGLDINRLKETDTGALNTKESKYINFLRAIMHGPEILFLDSMFDGADLQANRMMRQQLQPLIDEGGHTFFAASGSVSSYEQYAKRVLVLDNGKIYFDGTLQEFKKQSKNDDYLKGFYL